MSTVLVVAPHPDDETLGCGGTLLRHKAEGDDIHWLIMTTINENIGYSSERVATRNDEIKQVSEAYGFSSVKQLGFIAADLDVLPKKVVVEEVSKNFNLIKPDTVYVPFRYDVHSDHQVVFDAVSACSKSFRYPFIKRIRAYETLSETEFNIRPDGCNFSPNLWLDISPYISRKIEIMNMYQGEIDEHPFPRSEQNIRALSILRGARAGLNNAEAFMTLVEIV